MTKDMENDPAVRVMAVVAVVAMFVVLCLPFACNNEKPGPQSIVVIEVYQEEVNANDGVVEKDWMTLIQLDAGSRQVVSGKWGVAGDTIRNMIVGACGIHPYRE